MTPKARGPAASSHAAARLEHVCRTNCVASTVARRLGTLAHLARQNARHRRLLAGAHLIRAITLRRLTPKRERGTLGGRIETREAAVCIETREAAVCIETFWSYRARRTSYGCFDGCAVCIETRAPAVCIETRRSYRARRTRCGCFDGCALTRHTRRSPARQNAWMTTRRGLT